MTLVADLPLRTEKVAVLFEPAPHQDKQVVLIPTEQDPFADRKHWTQTECDALEKAGLFTPGEYELINGEIVKKLGQFVPHSRANLRVALALTLTFGADNVLIPVSVPIDDANTPEPDASVTKKTTDQYMQQRKPLPADLWLAVEVSDTTLWRDRNTKMLLYAQAGVPEYWVLDINGRTLWVHRSPSPAGYADIKEYDEAAHIIPQAAPVGTVPIRIVDLLP